MSVYIKIKKANLNVRPKNPIYLLIESQSAVLKTIQTPSSKNPFFQSSFISSIRQRSLYFKICENTHGSGLHIPSTTSLVDGRHNIIAVGQLPFQYFDYQPRIQITRFLDLVSQNKNGFIKQGNLELSIYYDSQKNYVGQIDIIKCQNNGSNVKGQSNPNNFEKKKSKSNISFFSKCKNPSNTSGMSEGHTKNLFNCCDRPVNQQDIQLLEPHYFKD